MRDLIHLLKRFGFTETEAKVYIALLQNGVCTGYEASKYSSVPRSKVYGALESLLNRGALAASEGERASLYKAVPVESLVRLLRESTEDALDELSRSAARFEIPKDSEQIWHLADYSTILSKCAELIDSAQEEVLLQIWREDLSARIEESMVHQQATGLRTLTVLYDSQGRYDTRIQQVYAHGYEADKLAEFGARWITLTVDNREMLHASIRSAANAEALFTKNASMVFFAAEYVMHDAYCLRLIDKLKENVQAVFGEDMEGVRNVFATQ
ncbi:MAG: TrmB family transcriptional regulator [Clostridia bacterium]|nr:helix-turn-helix domain-containing protein [Candidatus Pelethousia sp.]NCB30656.1 TrmB family transcriptional regulator [Clostridia bacterium]